MKSSEKQRRRAPFPLWAKIMVCLFLNVILAAGVAGWLLKAHFGVGENWILNEAARGRLQAMSQVLTADLNETPSEQWDSLLERTGEAHRVRLALFDVAGRHVAGPEMSLPSSAVERLRRSPAMPSQGRRLFIISRETDEVVDSSSPERIAFRDEERTAFEAQRDFPKEAFRTHEPDGYWFMVRLPHAQRLPMVVVGMTEKLGETGLLFDPKPWLWSAAGVFGFSVLLWLPLVRSVTGSISEMTRATEKIALGRFDTRVDESRRDELGRLGGAINCMTGRLEGFVLGQKRFLGDVAHELCSPLARMELALGVLEDRIQGTARERLDDVREDLSEMQALVSELLAFSKAGLESTQAKLEVVPLAPLVRDVVAREASKARIGVDVADAIRVRAAPVLLKRALANLLRNAVQYAGESPAITIDVSTEGGLVKVRICDRGPGVPDEELPHLFEPFYRADPSRNRATGGVGLGLAIVKGCIESCGGSVCVKNRQGGGLQVDVYLKSEDLSPKYNRSDRRRLQPNQPFPP